MIRAASAAILALTLAACTPAAQTPTAIPAPEPAVAPPVAAVEPSVPAGQTMTPPNAIEAACLAAVRQASGQARVVIISSDFADDATSVVVGAGLPLVNWRCTVVNGAVSAVTPEAT
jgi:hypothetical protein